MTGGQLQTLGQLLDHDGGRGQRKHSTDYKGRLYPLPQHQGNTGRQQQSQGNLCPPHAKHFLLDRQ